MAPAAEEAVVVMSAAAAAPAQPARAVLSEAWSVTAKHEGCYTGGKVAWCEVAGDLACLCDEELHLVSAEGHSSIRKVAQEADPVLTFAVDPSGKNACTSHRSGLMRHFKVGEKVTLERSWKAHESVVADVCFDSTCNFVATGSVDKTAKVWDFAGYFCTHNFKGHPALVSKVLFHPSKLQLVTIADTEVRLWDLKTSSLLGIMKDHLTSISSLAFGRIEGSEHQLVTGGRDQVVNVWKLEDKPSLARSIPVFENVEGVAAVPTRALLDAARCAETAPFAAWLLAQAKVPAYVILTVGDKCQLRVWNPLDGKCVATFQSPHAAKGALRQVMCIDQAAGSKIITVGEDMNLVVWTLPEFKVSNYIMGHNEEIVHVQMIPQLTFEVPEPGAPEVLKTSAESFVCIANDEHPRIVRKEGFHANLLRGHTDIVISCDVSVDGKFIATGGKDQSVRVWSAETQQCAAVIAGHTAAVSALSFAKRRPKGPKALEAAQAAPVWLFSGSQDKTMKAWELPSPQKLAAAAVAGGEPLTVSKSSVAVIAHAKDVNHVIVAPNNKVVASAGSDKLVRIWSYPELKLLGECKGHRKAVWCVAFSPSDQVIASASGDSTVRLWNLKDYSAIRAFQGHMGAVLRVCFLGNGMQLMSSGSDGLLKLWQIRTAECAATFDEHEGKVWCIDMLDDTLVSGGSDSKICLWRDSTEETAQERHDASAEMKMKDTKIGLLVQEGKIEKALTLALELDRPGQMRQILTNFTMDAIGHKLDGEDAAAAAEEQKKPEVDMRRWVRSLKDSQLEKFVAILEQWNSNRKMAALAQMFLSILLEVVPAEKLMKIEGMNATCDGLLSYLTRHQARTDSLLQKTFLFDLVMQSSGLGLALMDEFNGESQQASAADDKEGVHDPTAMTKAEELKKGNAEDALAKTMEVLLGRKRPGEDVDEEEDQEGSEEEDDDSEDENEAEEEEDEKDGEAASKTRPAKRARKEKV